MSNLLFYYFGDDEAYFKALQGEFKQHAKAPINFIRIFETKDTKIQSLFLKVFADKPACVFIDFSKNTQDYLHLARIISRATLEQEMLLVGLVDYLSPPEVMEESLATGVKLNFIKSAETFDVVFAVSKLAIPNGIADHGFANASLKEELDVGILCKVGFVRPEGIHVETDHNLSKGDRIVLDHHWLQKRVVPSKSVFVKEVSTSNMFYQFKCNADLDFIFVDEFIPAEGMDDATIKHKKTEREDLVLYHKKQLKRWMDDNRTEGSEKRAKVLVVDYNFRFYQDQPRTDKHAYTIRCIPFLTDIKLELDRLKPQIIAFEIQTADGGKNNLDSLRQLVFACDRSTYIIVFNSPMVSQDLQADMKYPNIMAYQEELSPEILLKMAEALQKKLSGVVVEKSAGPKVYLKKTHPSSLAQIIKNITVVKLSETDMVIQSDFPFAAGTNLHFSKPVHMVVNLQPVAKPSGKLPEFYGIIHSLGENEKKELRRYVNAVFFREHDALVSAETDEFKKLNDLKLQERLAAEAKAVAETEATEAAEAEKKEPESEVS